MASIYVSTSTFGESSPEPRRMLECTQHKITYNELGRKLEPAETAELAAECEVLIAGTEDLTPIVESSKALKMISRVGIGLDSVPLELCRQKGIPVAYTPDAVTMAVAELTVGLMIDQLRFVNQNSIDLKRGLWKRPIGKRIEHCVIGLVGFGRVGSNVARMLSGLRPKQILVHDIKDVSSQIKALSEGCSLNIKPAGLDEIVSNSDIVSFHVPYTRKTQGMLNESLLNQFKPGSFLINTARGQIADEQALYNALAEGQLAGAAIDVFHQEPYTGPLANLPNALLTAHIGSCSEDCRYLMETHSAEDALRFLDNLPLLRPVPEEEYFS